MVEFKYDNLVGFEGKKASGLGFEAVERYSFEGEISTFKEHLKNTYDVYQLTENIEYKKHQLFYWSNSSNHFTLNMNTELLSKSEMETIHAEIMNKLNNEFKELNIFAVIKTDYVLSVDKIENFLKNYVFDIDNLELEKFSVITVNYTSSPKISLEAKHILNDINEQFLQLAEGKKAIINGNLEGSFKRLGDRVVFFKKRVRKSYYDIALNNVNTVQFI